MRDFFASHKHTIRQTFSLSLPIIAGQLGQVLMGFFDTVQIGGMGHEYIAASGFANGLYWMTTLLGLGVFYAVSPLVSEAFGEKQPHRAIGFYRGGLILSLVLGALLMVVIHLVGEHLYIYRHPESDNIIAGKYLKVINYSTVFIFLFACAKQFLDGMGNTRPGMIITLAGLVLNVLLNEVLIYGRMGLPAMGIEGAAIASCIARGFMAIGLMVYAFNNRDVKELRAQYMPGHTGYFTYAWQILKIGVPTGLQFFWEVAAFNAGQIMSGWISIEDEAAHMIAIGLASVTFMVITGYSAAASILAGYAYGAKNRTDVLKTGRAVFVITFGTELLFAALFLLFASYLPYLYTDNKQVVEIATTLLMFAAVFQLSDGLQCAATGLLRGIQDVTIPSAFAFVAYWLVMVPAGYLLAFKAGMGIKGIWLGFLMGLSIAAVFLWLRFWYKANRLPNYTIEKTGD